MSDSIDYIAPGKQPTAHDFNRLIDMVESLAGSTQQKYFRDSRGVHTAKLPTVFPATLRIFQITGNALADYIYECEEKLIDSTYWPDVLNHTKLINKGDPDVDVFNIGEAGSTTEHALAVNDILIGFEMRDDAGIPRLVGWSPRFAWWKS